MERTVTRQLVHRGDASAISTWVAWGAGRTWHRGSLAPGPPAVVCPFFPEKPSLRVCPALWEGVSIEVITRACLRLSAARSPQFSAGGHWPLEKLPAWRGPPAFPVGVRGLSVWEFLSNSRALLRVLVPLTLYDQGSLGSLWRRKAADHVGAPGRGRHAGQHGFLHLQGRGQPQARDHLAPKQVSASGWGSGPSPRRPVSSVVGTTLHPRPRHPEREKQEEDAFLPHPSCSGVAPGRLLAVLAPGAGGWGAEGTWASPAPDPCTFLRGAPHPGVLWGPGRRGAPSCRGHASCGDLGVSWCFQSPSCPVSALQQRAEHGGRLSPEPAGRRDADDPEHAGGGPGRVPVHGQERGRGGQDAGGHPEVLRVSRYGALPRPDTHLLLCPRCKDRRPCLLSKCPWPRWHKAIGEP